MTRLDQFKEARDEARRLMIKAQESWVKHRDTPKYKVGDLVWLEGKNLRTAQPTAKLAPRRHGPFKVVQVMSPVNYRLELPTQWSIHPVFHIDLLTPYRETPMHGANYQRPPPDLVSGEEEYEVEKILDSRLFGRRRRLQYLVKWKGYPDSDNMWVDKDDVFAEDKVREFKVSNPGARTHIRKLQTQGEFPHSPPHSLITPHIPRPSCLTPRLPSNPSPSPLEDKLLPPRRLAPSQKSLSSVMRGDLPLSTAGPHHLQGDAPLKYSDWQRKALHGILSLFSVVPPHHSFQPIPVPLLQMVWILCQQLDGVSDQNHLPQDTGPQTTTMTSHDRRLPPPLTPPENAQFRHNQQPRLRRRPALVTTPLSHANVEGGVSTSRIHSITTTTHTPTSHQNGTTHGPRPLLLKTRLWGPKLSGAMDCGLEQHPNGNDSMAGTDGCQKNLRKYAPRLVLPCEI